MMGGRGERSATLKLGVFRESLDIHVRTCLCMIETQIYRLQQKRASNSDFVIDRFSQMRFSTAIFTCLAGAMLTGAMPVDKG